MANNNDRKHQAEWEALTIDRLDPGLMDRIRTRLCHGPNDYRSLKPFLTKLSDDVCNDATAFTEAMASRGVTVGDLMTACSSVNRGDVLRLLSEASAKPAPCIEFARPRKERVEAATLRAMLASERAEVATLESEVGIDVLKAHPQEYNQVAQLLGTNDMFRTAAVLCDVDDYVDCGQGFLSLASSKGLSLDRVLRAINGVIDSDGSKETNRAIREINAVLKKL